MRTDRRTVMANLIVALWNFANTPKNEAVLYFNDCQDAQETRSSEAPIIPV